MASSPKSSPRLDDASMSFLSRAEEIIQDELGEEQLNERQQNQSATFKVALSFYAGQRYCNGLASVCLSVCHASFV